MPVRSKRIKGSLFVAGWIVLAITMLLFVRYRVRTFDVYVTNGTVHSVEHVTIVCGNQEYLAGRLLAGMTVRLRIRPPRSSALHLRLDDGSSAPVTHVIPVTVHPGDGGEIRLSIQPDLSISVINDLKISPWW